MFRKVVNCGLICVLHADNDAPLKLWGKKLRDGKLKRVTDTEAKGQVLEFTGKVPYINYLSCPSDSKTQLGIRYPFLVFAVKAGDGRFFALDVQILDDTGTRRRFRFATGQVTFEVQPFYCRLPLILEEGWNKVVLPLHHLTREVYGTRFLEILRLQIYPFCRLKTLYFADKDYDEEELPKEFQHRRSPFAEHVAKNRCGDARNSDGLVSTQHSVGSRARKGDRIPDTGKYSVREVIPRVIPIKCGSKDTRKIQRCKNPRATYSSL